MLSWNRVRLMSACLLCSFWLHLPRKVPCGSRHCAPFQSQCSELSDTPVFYTKQVKHSQRRKIRRHPLQPGQSHKQPRRCITALLGCPILCFVRRGVRHTPMPWHLGNQPQSSLHAATARACVYPHSLHNLRVIRIISPIGMLEWQAIVLEMPAGGASYPP
jgi:hypothetical protein